MAQRKTTASNEPRKRIRRTDEQLIQDLQAKIEDIQRRDQAREAKRSPSIRLAVRALRAIDQAIAAAEGAKGDAETELRHVLSDSREPLAGFLQTKGLAVGSVRRPKGPRRKPQEH